MACRGDVDTEDLEQIVSIARSGENILCGYLKDFEDMNYREEMYECEEDY